MSTQETIKQEKIKESARLSGLLAMFSIYIDVLNDNNGCHSSGFLSDALELHIKDLEKDSFKYYKSEFEASKIEIEKVLYQSQNAEYKELKQEHQRYTYFSKIYNDLANKIIRPTQKVLFIYVG
ncbi:6891_t:CDS:1 [Cetraspora pellucida]|uniref:6891_t:CDS:1 n=1 Tax=Cetraspora pellucida TaxID=1433469 RepID=A0A9N8VN92_9GLOM|nr:6891_t:CDS:1 [Cetraspora pellucida]